MGVKVCSHIVGVFVGVNVNVAVGPGVSVNTGVEEGVGVSVAVLVGAGVLLGVGVTPKLELRGFGAPDTKSLALLFVSVAPPLRRKIAVVLLGAVAGPLPS